MDEALQLLKERNLIRYRHNATLIPCVCQLTGHTASVQANVFRSALSPRQSDSQISAPLSFKTSCNPVLVIFSLLCSAFNHIYIIIYLIVFVLYCLLLLSLTFLVIQPLGCERDINKLLLLLLLLLLLEMIQDQLCTSREDKRTNLRNTLLALAADSPSIAIYTCTCTPVRLVVGFVGNTFLIMGTNCISFDLGGNGNAIITLVHCNGNVQNGGESVLD